MSKADKKQRQKAKRKAKQHEARRRESASPVKRLAEARGEFQCWISDKFEEFNQLEIFVHKRGAGMVGMAAFLIDRGVVGLKDAWTRMNVDEREFLDIIKSCRDRGIPMRKANLEEARHWVAGSARWANDHGMRLPKDWTKTALLIGGAGDWQNADVSEFCKEFAGHPQDLRQRLIGEPYETFIKRRDIEFIFDESAPYSDDLDAEDEYDESEDPFDDFDEMDEDELDEAFNEIPEEELQQLSDGLNPAVTVLVSRTTQWLAELMKMASPELFEAWMTVIMATMMSKIAMPEAENKDDAALGMELIQNLSQRIEPSRHEEYLHALEQVTEHLRVDPVMFKSILSKMLKNSGLDDDPSRMP